MDNKIIRFYNQNRYLVWIVILTVVAIISLIQILNSYVIEKNSLINIDSSNIAIDTKEKQNYSIITRKQINPESSNTIKLFVDYCNNKKIEEAYSLLTDECKELLYPDIKSFTTKYVNKIFNTKKLVAYQAMVNNNGFNTYLVNFTEDMLATRENSRKKHNRLLHCCK